jgi:UDP-N-acetylmuramoyl-tripeptide--D-alanyl-D-alanine ligase
MNGYSIEEVSSRIGGVPLARPSGAPLRGGPRASIDTRTLEEGEIFFAIPGERTDGHAFLAEAFRKGASFAVVRGDRSGALGAGLPLERVVAVPDTTEALVRLARAHRDRFSPEVHAVTGSNGKTTTKELLASIFEADAPALATIANYNTLLGLALTLLRLDGSHRRVVAELGISAPGEMARLASLARPHAAILTNAHAAHLEGLGSVESVAREKCVLLSSLEGERRVFVNGDDPVLLGAVRASGLAFRTFGTGAECDVRPESLEPWRTDGVRLRLAGGGTFAASLYGRHHAYNLLAALAAARAAGIPDETIERGLSAFRPPAGRFRPERVGGVLLVDDTYNANLASTLGAIEFLRNVEAAGKRILVLGDMRELGPREEEDHREAGRAAAAAGLDLLALVGESVRWTAEGALAAGLPAPRVLRVGERRGLGARLAADLEDGDCLVVKGSRALRMEEILADLRRSLAEASAGRRS